MWPTRSKASITRAQSFGSWRAVCLGLALSLLLPAALHSEATDPAAARVSTLYDALLRTMKQAKQVGLKDAPILASPFLSGLPLSRQEGRSVAEKVPAKRHG